MTTIATTDGTDGDGRGRGASSPNVAALVVAIVLVVVWCAFIFYMSSRVADESGAMSGGFSFNLMSLLWPDFASLSAADQQQWCDVLDYPVRKCAHFSEYALLGVLAANLALRVKRAACCDRHAWLSASGFVIAWACATLYATSDEIHQAFVPGRACLATDIMIDSTGVLVGILLFAVISQVMRYNRNRERLQGA